MSCAIYAFRSGNALRLFRGRRGSAMVEAAVVLPLLILSLITCILICMFFYDTAIQQYRLHQDLRCAADDLTGRTVNLSDSSPALPENEGSRPDQLIYGRQGMFQTISGKENTGMIHRGILKERVSSRIESLWHASDGVTYVRYCTLAKDFIDRK